MMSSTQADGLPGLSRQAENGLGSVDVSSRTALLRQISPGKAQDAGNGCSLAKSCNTAWCNLPRNPKGRACFCARLRFSSLIWNNQTTLLVPCHAQKQAPARPRTKRQQTLILGSQPRQHKGKKKMPYMINTHGKRA